MTMQMPKVLDCTVSGCAYNNNNECHAIAITIGDPTKTPACDTYFTAERHGGAKDMTAGVGACKCSGCSHNEDYECCADAIHIAMRGNRPDCTTFEEL